MVIDQRIKLFIWEWAGKNKDFIDWTRIKRNVLIPEPCWLDEEIQKQISRNIRFRKFWSKEEEKEVYHLYYSVGMKQKDIAHKMGRTKNSIERKISKIRKSRIERGKEIC